MAGTGTVEKKSVAEIVANAYKKNDLRIAPLGQAIEGVKAIPSGNMQIDQLTGVNGFPMGRSIELFGPPASGKTTTAAQVAAALQKMIIAGGDEDRGIAEDDYILYVDYEQSVDTEYFEALGIDPEHPSFLITQPDTIEQAGDIVVDLIKTGKVRLVIFDSVASMMPAAALEAETGRISVAEQARALAPFVRKLNVLSHNYNTTVVYINHEQELINIGGRPGMPPVTSTPGGKALKYYASLRIQYRQLKRIKGTIFDEVTQEDVERDVATLVQVAAVKNKVGSPFKKQTVRVRFGKGFDNYASALLVLTAHKKIVAGAGGYLYWEKSPELIHDDMPRGATSTQRPYLRGESTWFEFADEHPEWRQSVIAAAEKVLAEIGVPTQLDQTVEIESDPEEEIEPETA